MRRDDRTGPSATGDRPEPPSSGGPGSCSVSGPAGAFASGDVTQSSGSASGTAGELFLSRTRVARTANADISTASTAVTAAPIRAQLTVSYNEAQVSPNDQSLCPPAETPLSGRILRLPRRDS